MLTNGLKILDTTKRDIYKLKFSQSDGKIRYYCRPDFTIVFDTLICWLSSSVLKYDSLEIYVNTSFAVCNFRNTKLWGPTFFSKCSKLNGDFRNAVKKAVKTFSFRDNWIWIGCVKSWWQVFPWEEGNFTANNSIPII